MSVRVEGCPGAREAVDGMVDGGKIRRTVTVTA